MENYLQQAQINAVMYRCARVVQAFEDCESAYSSKNPNATMDDVAKHCKKELEDAEKAMALQSKCEPKLKSLADCIRTNQQKDLKPCEDSLVAFVGCIDDFANNK